MSILFAASHICSYKCYLFIAKFLQFQPKVQQKFFNWEEDYNTVVEASTIKEYLLNLGLELKKLRDEFY